MKELALILLFSSLCARPAFCGAAARITPAGSAYSIETVGQAICTLPAPLQVRVVDFLQSPIYKSLDLSPTPEVKPTIALTLGSAIDPAAVRAAVQKSLAATPEEMPVAAQRWAELQLKTASLLPDERLRQTLAETARWARRQLQPEQQAELDKKMRQLAAALDPRISAGADAIEFVAPDGTETGNFAHRNARLKKPSYGTTRFQKISLLRSIKASGLEGRIQDIRTHAQAVLTIYDFLREHPTMPPGYLLGLSTFRNASPLVAGMTGLKTWETTYRELFGRTMEGPMHEFMGFITRSGRPIVILVPNDYAGHSNAKRTRDEIDWLLAEPKERMKNVYFVFGAYDMLPVKDDAARSAADRGQIDDLSAALRDYLKGRPSREP